MWDVAALRDWTFQSDSKVFTPVARLSPRVNPERDMHSRR